MPIVTIKLEINQNCYTKENINHLAIFIHYTGHFFHHLATFYEKFWPLIIFISGNPD